MVYTGKPSRACGRCRTRRLKCDFEKPQCRKCQAAGTACPGYRSQQDLRFRNVTDQVIDRHTKRANSRADGPEEDAGAIQSSTGKTDAIAKLATIDSTSKEARGLTLPNAPTIPSDGVLAVSLTYLFKCYLLDSSFEWVEALYKDDSTLFADVVQATALAAYSHESHRRSLLARARTAYSECLIKLRADITASDSTLASILLMSRFETLLMDGNITSITENWSGHIAGAFSLIKSRTDEENFAHDLSYRLSEQTIHNFNLFCVRAGTPRPESLIEATTALQRWTTGNRDTQVRRRRLKLHDLSDAYRRCHFDFGKSSKASENALAMCERLEEFEDELRHEPVVTHHHARIWNSSRMMRLTLHLDLMKVGMPSRPMVEQACQEICDSAPQFLRPNAYAAASYLAWPLFVAARADSKHVPYVKDVLQWMGDELRIKCAEVAAGELDQPEYSDDWLLACYIF